MKLAPGCKCFLSFPECMIAFCGSVRDVFSCNVCYQLFITILFPPFTKEYYLSNLYSVLSPSSVKETPQAIHSSGIDLNQQPLHC